MRVLVITSLFPNATDPRSSPFNRQQFAALRSLCDVEVWATIPWHPGRSRRTRRIPAEEWIDGLRVWHPRTPYVPGTGHAFSVPLFVAALAPAMRRRRRDFDVVLGSWAYPDGAAAVALGQLAGLPAAIKLHGSDINVMATMRVGRFALEKALPAADAVIAVSRPLAEQARKLGASKQRIHLVRNGVDRGRFCLRDRGAARRQLGLDDRARWILYCGHLKRSKGIEDLLDAFSSIARQRPDVRLAVVGDGRVRRRCESLAAELGGRILVAGSRPHDEIPAWLAACDVLALPSWSEGTPNVVLEALACGRRVVATDVGGTADLLPSKTLGEVVAAHSPVELGAALSRALASPYDPRDVAREADVVGWDESAAALHDALASAVAGSDGSGPSAFGRDGAAISEVRRHG